VVTHRDRERAESFGANAERYDRSRPSYPPELFDDLLDDGVRQALDVGCGTGIVARLLFARGLDVVGVEADPRMAEVARGHGIAVEVAPFERWEDRGRRFDALVSGQAWHWIDPGVGARRAAALLRPGGRLGTFWNGMTHAPQVLAAFEAVYQQIAPELLVDSVALGSWLPPDAHDRAIEAGPFTDVEQRVYLWERVYSTATWIDQLATNSDHQQLDPARRAAILTRVAAGIDDLGGAITVGFRTSALFATRR
jgi:SAM-dependent methyltransferase